MSDQDDSKTGYKKPPKHTQFKKGQSGNPKGRPKKSRNMLTLLKDELEKSVIINENGSQKKISKMEAMVKRIVTGALNGDHKSMATLVDILRRANQMEDEQTDTGALVPENYEQILENYVQRQIRQASKSKSTRKQSKEKRDD